MSANRQIFVNLPVADLPKSRAFFESLGFAFNPQFSDDTAACMLVGEGAFVMLLTHPKFTDFTDNAICDTSSHTEALICFSCESRDEVEALVGKAIAAGGRHAQKPLDYGFMFGWSFYDLDGHHWELMWMNPDHIQQ